jgi:transcriptional regulator with XRE-family HTH domain
LYNVTVVTVAERLGEAMAAQRVSQSGLARAVGATQGSISLILLGKTTNSRLLPKIATFLGVSLAWLLGMSDDQGDTGVVPVVPPQVMLPVVLPSENALADMFEGLLLVIDELQPIRERGLDEVARELAQLLPTGLSQLQGRLFELPRPPRQRAPAAKAKSQALASGDHEHPQ